MNKLLTFLFLSLLHFSAFGQILITGTVQGEDGLPLPGVNVIIEGTSDGTITNIDGNYSIKVNTGNDVLQFSFMGYVPLIVSVNDRDVIDVVLKEDLQELEEVVVIGYGTQKKEDLTTSLVSVDSEELGKVSSSTFTHSLQGKAAGVIVNSESGQPGGGTSVRIRGYGALNNNDPLYVVDGVILNAYTESTPNPTQVGQTPSNDILASINPSDIESINILKDASATAIYGSRAGNGVVLITTKKGKKGGTKISFDGYYGIQSVGQKIDLMTGEEFAEFSNEARINAGMVPYSGYAHPDSLSNTNWQNELFRSSPMQNYQLAVSGGTEKGTYYFSAGYFDQEGILPNSYYNRFSVRINSNQRIHERITIGNTFTISQSKSNSLSNGNLHSGVVLGALRMPGYIPVSDAVDGNTIYYGVGDYESLFSGRTQNPYHAAIRSYNRNNINKLLGNLFVDAEIVQGLKLKANLSLDQTNSNGGTFDAEFINPPFLNQSENPISYREIPTASSTFYSESNVTLDLTLTYNKSFAKNNITAMAGHTAQEIVMNNTYTTSSGHLTNTLVTTAAGDPSTQVGSNSKFELAYESYIGRFLYNYDSKYYLSYSYRRDGSSRFGSGLKFANFHSVSAAWRVSGEEFMEPLKSTISDLKLRGSWGQTGIDGSLPPVEFPKVQNHFGYVFNGSQFVTGYAPVGVPNPRLRWETAQQIDVGIDMRLFKGKVDFVADYFIKKQFDIITQKPIPFLLGITDEIYSPVFPVEIVNGPEVLNQGYELSLNLRSNSGDFFYNIGVNFTSFKNEITKLENDIISDSYNGYNIIINREGNPINQFYGFKTDGLILDPDDKALERQPGASLGDVKYVDLVPDGIIDDNDRTIIGSPIPDFTYGLNLSIEYRNYDLSAAFQGVEGNELYNANMGWILSSKDGSNRHANMNDRWSEDNSDGQFPRAIATDPNNNARASDLFVEDGSYFRLQNLELGFSLPESFQKTVKISQFRIYVSAQNLFTITEYSGYSPEVGTRGIDASVYPVSRRILLGVNLSF